MQLYPILSFPVAVIFIGYEKCTYFILSLFYFDLFPCVHECDVTFKMTLKVPEREELINSPLRQPCLLPPTSPLFQLCSLYQSLQHLTLPECHDFLLPSLYHYRTHYLPKATWQGLGGTTHFIGKKSAASQGSCSSTIPSWFLDSAINARRLTADLLLNCCRTRPTMSLVLQPPRL